MRKIKKFVPDFIVRYYRGFRRKRVMADHSGNAVICPICNSHFAEFAPSGLVVRKNAQCYYCGSLERHRLLWKYFNDRTNLFDGEYKRLLHFAPEGIFYNMLSKAEKIKYVPCDLFPEKYTYLNAKIKITCADITKIPFEDSSFDIVICIHVLEHIPDDRLAMSELHRVMKKGGWAILQVPIFPIEATYEDFTITTPEGREKAFGQHDHVRCYGKDYKERLESVGFQVIEDDYIESFSEEEIHKFGFIPHELIYLCRKTS
jgi:SAM-dependent methyltransferase